MNRIRGKLTYSNVISTLCLVLVLGGGTAYAAKSLLPKNSVGSRQLKKGAVTPVKLAPAATKALTGPAGPKGSTGATGPKGDTGPAGPAGQGRLFAIAPEAAQIVTGPATVGSLNLPAGSYLINGKLNALDLGTEGSSRIECSLVNGATTLDFIKLRLAPNNSTMALVFGEVPIQASVTLGAPATIGLACQSSLGSEIEVSQLKLSALTVSSIN